MNDILLIGSPNALIDLLAALQKVLAIKNLGPLHFLLRILAWRLTLSTLAFV